MLLPATAAAAEPTDSLARFLARVQPYVAGIDETALRQHCGASPCCAATRIAEAAGSAARLVPIQQPTTDVIRWVETRDSVGDPKRLADGRRLVQLKRFGRKVERELNAALDGADDIVLDLRANAGGDFGRMLRVAGLLIGPRAGAVILRTGDRTERRDLPAVDPGPRPHGIIVLVGPATASSAEVLTALLRRYAGAEVLGSRTAGKDYLLRVVPVDNDWRLLLPAERIEVPGETLAGGIVPDRPAPAALLAALAP
jgi:hypothetical protein